jgi:hypothetical protein
LPVDPHDPTERFTWWVCRVAAGLSCRPLARTLADTAAWAAGVAAKDGTGLGAHREAALLGAWRARSVDRAG